MSGPGSGYGSHIYTCNITTTCMQTSGADESVVGILLMPKQNTDLIGQPRIGGYLAKNVWE